MVKNSVTQQPETTAVRQALIVEGSATYRRTLCKVFAQAGYRTSGVENLNHALAALTQAAYNLVVIDLFSPYQGRLGLLQTIVAKASPGKVLVLTEFGDPTSLEKIAAAGVLCCLVKPVKRREILGALEGIGL